MNTIVRQLLNCFLSIVVFSIVLSCSDSKKNTTTIDSKKHSEFRERLIYDVKMMNKQCPVQTDECTVFKQVTLSGNTMFVKAMIKDRYIDLVNFDIFKEKMSENYSKLLEKEFVEFIKEYGYSIKYVVYDENDKIITTIDITGSDILKYYN